jgi:hypothetical protein
MSHRTPTGGAQHSQSDRRKPVRIALTALRGFDNLLGQNFLEYGRPSFGVKGPAGNVIGLAHILGRFGIESVISKKWYLFPLCFLLAI